MLSQMAARQTSCVSHTSATFNKSHVYKRRPYSIWFGFAVFFSAILIACSPAFGQAEFREPMNDERNPGRGVRVLQVAVGGTAARLRLQPMDQLTRYGKFKLLTIQVIYQRGVELIWKTGTRRWRRDERSSMPPSEMAR